MPSRRAISAVTSDRVLPGCQLLGPQDVRREIAVAELEPGLAAEPLHRRHEIPGLAGEPPAAFRIVQVGERVEHRVDVGRDVQAEMDEIVGGVDHDASVPSAAGRPRGRVQACRRRHRRPAPGCAGASSRTISAMARRSRRRPADAGWPSVISACGCQSEAAARARAFTVSGQNSGAHIQQAASPSAWASSRRFCAAMAVLCTAISRSASARRASA